MISIQKGTTPANTAEIIKQTHQLVCLLFWNIAMLNLQFALTQLLRHMKPRICRNLAKMKLLLMIVVYGMTSGVAYAADYATVLMYHRFGEDKYPSTNIRIEQFEAHLDMLINGDYTIWPLDKIVDHLQQGLDLPDKTVAITIDDAYLSVFIEARPRLKARNLP